jgi:hypothetical protein
MWGSVWRLLALCTDPSHQVVENGCPVGISQGRLTPSSLKMAKLREVLEAQAIGTA